MMASLLALLSAATASAFVLRTVLADAAGSTGARCASGVTVPGMARGTCAAELGLPKGFRIRGGEVFAQQVCVRSATLVFAEWSVS